jgi:molybdate transport system substrate-binding protein
MKASALVVGAFLALLVGVGCSGSPPPAQLTILAASSLSTSLPDLTTAWKQTHPQTNLVTSTGSSAALRTQIEQGAPADVFLSADTSNPQALVDESQGIGPVTNFATNSLVVIVPSANPKGITSPADLGKSGVCVIAAGTSVPITKYAEQVATNLAAQQGYGSDFAARYDTNVCSREDNVGAVVSKVSLGEGDAAIVYSTDAEAATNVTTIQLPAAANVIATYGGVVVKSSTATSTATDFLTWLHSTGQTTLAAHGFGAAP